MLIAKYTMAIPPHVKQFRFCSLADKQIKGSIPHQEVLKKPVKERLQRRNIIPPQK